MNTIGKKKYEKLFPRVYETNAYVFNTRDVNRLAPVTY